MYFSFGNILISSPSLNLELRGTLNLFGRDVSDSGPIFMYSAFKISSLVQRKISSLIFLDTWPTKYLAKSFKIRSPLKLRWILDNSFSVYNLVKSQLQLNTYKMMKT